MAEQILNTLESLGINYKTVLIPLQLFPSLIAYRTDDHPIATRLYKTNAWALDNVAARLPITSLHWARQKKTCWFFSRLFRKKKLIQYSKKMVWNWKWISAPQFESKSSPETTSDQLVAKPGAKYVIQPPENMCYSNWALGCSFLSITGRFQYLGLVQLEDACWRIMF